MPPPPPANVEVYIAADRRAEYGALRASSRSEDRRIGAMLERAVGVLKKNPYAGDRIRRRQIPAEYQRRYGPLDNLVAQSLAELAAGLHGRPGRWCGRGRHRVVFSR